MKSIYLFILLSTSLFFGQTKISGKVIDKKGKPISEVNVFIDGTYDGVLTNQNGEFAFDTEEKGMQLLKMIKIGYEDLIESIEIEKHVFKNFILLSSSTEIEGVVVSAGTIKAGENSKVTTLSSYDIVTTAGSMGNIISALETQPGVQTVGEDGRLFVRGGDANEAQTYVDGIRVAQPYGSTLNNVPARSRFSPFLFKGITFSTGGYSAEFGDALSSVLQFNTLDEADQNKTEISLMTVGAGLGKTQKWKKSSLSVNGSYINLAPYYLLVPQNLDWNKAFQSWGGEGVFRYKFNNKGIFKMYAAYEGSTVDLNQEDINYANKIRTALDNNNFYFNSSYKGNLSNYWQLFVGLSGGIGVNKFSILDQKIKNQENAFHVKVKLRQKISNRIKMNYGIENFYTNFKENFSSNNVNTFDVGYQNALNGFFSEAEVSISPEFAFNAGVRLVKTNLIESFKVEPRISLAYQLAPKNQVSFAYGLFHQTPNQEVLKYNTNIDFEQSNHMILNYLYNGEGKTLRAEAYYKKYDNLIKYNTNVIQFDSQFNNDGNGYARGFDVFWRDKKLIKNLDYWVTYFFLDTKRDFRNYPNTATPNIASKHSLSIVTRYFIESMKSQVGLTYSFNSGRPFNNPNSQQFMDGKTTNYNNFSLGWAYLLSQQKVLYFSVSNILNQKNVFGYQYANNPNANGVFQRREITQTADRFFFLGFFWTISDSKNDNHLDRL